MSKAKCLIVVVFAMLSALQVSAEPSACPKTDSLAFWIGGSGQVSDNVISRLRSKPTIESEILKELRGGTSFTVVGDFACADGYRWWQIKVDALTGWVAEGPETGGFFIEKNETKPPTIDNSALVDIWTAGVTTGSDQTADGMTLAVASAKGIWIYTGDDPQAKPRLLVERALSVKDVAFVPGDSNRLYAANEDNSLSRWNVAAGSVETVTQFDAPVKDIFFSETGRALVVVLENGEIDLFTGGDYATRMTLFADQAYSGLYISAVFSHDETRLALVTTKGYIDLYDLQGQRRATFSLGQGRVEAVAFNPDDTMLAASGYIGDAESYNRGMRLWEIRSQSVMAEIVYGDNDPTYVSSITYLPDGRMLTTQQSFMDYWRSIRDPQTLEVIQDVSVDTDLEDLPGQEPPVSFNLLTSRAEFILTPDESRMVIDDRDQLEVIDTQTGRTMMSWPHNEWHYSEKYTISADGRYFAMCSDGGPGDQSWDPTITVFDISGDGPTMPEADIGYAPGEGEVAVFPCNILEFVSTSEGERLVYDGFSPGELIFWDFNGHTVTRKYLSSPVLGFNSVLYGNILVSPASNGSYPDSVALYDLNQSGDLVPRMITPDWVFDGQLYRQRKTALASETTLAVTAGLGGRDVLLYDLATLTETGQVQTPSTVSALAVSKDGRWIVTSHGDGIIRMWDVNNPQTPIILGQVADVPNTLAFSADEQRLYSSGYTWDVSSIIGE